mgnify:CR=1 FL=1
MIDAEAEIFTVVSTKARAQFPDIFITGEYVSVPPSFPCISLTEIDNAVFTNSQTQEGSECHAAVTYELNVYSNKSKGRKAECKEIAAFVDDILTSMNFTRSMLEPISNQSDVSIYRMTGRYRAVIGKEHIIYRR